MGARLAPLQVGVGTPGGIETVESVNKPQCLSSFDLNTTQGQLDAARLRSWFGGPAGAFPTAMPGGCMTLSNDVLIVYVWGTMFPLKRPPHRANESAAVDGSMADRSQPNRLSLDACFRAFVGAVIYVDRGDPWPLPL